MCVLIFVCLHLYLSLQGGMALTYDPTAMQNGYVDLFFFPSYFQITKKKKREKEMHTFHLN